MPAHEGVVGFQFDFEDEPMASASDAWVNNDANARLTVDEARVEMTDELRQRLTARDALTKRSV